MSPDPPPSVAPPTELFCRHCGTFLVLTTPSQSAIVLAGALISHRVSLVCALCGTRQTWTPQDDHHRHTGAARVVR